MATLVRNKTSKIEQALKIFQSNLGKPNQRQLCLKTFQTKLGQEASTAATYYNLCMQKMNKDQQKVTDAVIASARKQKFSAVKLNKEGTVSKVHCFFKKADAAAYNSTFNYTDVVKGVAEINQKIA